MTDKELAPPVTGTQAHSPLEYSATTNTGSTDKMNPTPWSTRKKVALISAAVIAWSIILIGVAASDTSTPELADPVVAVAATAQPTTAAPVTAPPATDAPVTLPPATAPVVTAAPAFEYCGMSGPGISSSTQLSSLDAGYSDEYCKAFVYGYTNITSRDDACSEFWSSDDDDILNMFMFDVGSTYDEAVGLIDALWTVC